MNVATITLAVRRGSDSMLERLEEHIDFLTRQHGGKNLGRTDFPNSTRFSYTLTNEDYDALRDIVIASNQNLRETLRVHIEPAVYTVQDAAAS